MIGVKRVQYVLSEITGAISLPWMNFRLEEAFLPMDALIKDASLREGIGRMSRGWMEKYFSEEVTVKHFTRIYTDLLEKPEMFDYKRFNDGDAAAKWFVSVSNDLLWKDRFSKNAKKKELRENKNDKEKILTQIMFKLQTNELSKVKEMLECAKELYAQDLWFLKQPHQISEKVDKIGSLTGFCGHQQKAGV